MLYGLLLTLFIFVCILLVLIVLIQQGKGSIGIGGLGGQTQMLFGGSGGQDVFQKTTWVLGALFMFGSLWLTLYKSSAGMRSNYLRAERGLPVQQLPAQAPQETTRENTTAPVEAPAPEQPAQA